MEKKLKTQISLVPFKTLIVPFKIKSTLITDSVWYLLLKLTRFEMEIKDKKQREKYNKLKITICTYNIIGAGTSYPYSNWVVDLSTNLVHTFHSFETSSISSPIFLSLNLTDGSAKSPLYNFSVICSIVYHMESKDDNLYSTGIWGLYMTIIVFTKTSNIFKFYKYNTPNTVPYYLTIDPYTDR